MTVRRITVLGAGTAGLLAALTFKRKMPAVHVTVLRSKDIGIIGVGEGTNITFPQHFHEYLGYSLERFHDLVEPTWKLGIKFLWGPKKEFYYPFATEMTGRYPDVSRVNAAHVTPEDRWTGPISSLMAHDKVFARGKDGRPDLHNCLAYHVENRNLAAGLEVLCREEKVEIIEGTLTGTERGPEGIAALLTDDGQRVEGDLFIDASGFRSELMGRTLEEPFRSFDRSLYCDRAVVGGWERKGDPILPYTVAETMDAGWCWQIDHEHLINRGYVYSSRFLSDDVAREEFLRKNPRVAHGSTRVVKFVSGRRARAWVQNVVAIGNAGGFVEPLEATAIQVICQQSATLTKALIDCCMEPTDQMRNLYNRFIGDDWDDIRNFLSIHYRFNRRLDTEFWRTCRAEVDLAGAANLVEFWQQHGPSLLPSGILLWAGSAFGLEGYFALLKGQEVPVARPWQPPQHERTVWKKCMAGCGDVASKGYTTEESFGFFRTKM